MSKRPHDDNGGPPPKRQRDSFDPSRRQPLPPQQYQPDKDRGRDKDRRQHQRKHNNNKDNSSSPQRDQQQEQQKPSSVSAPSPLPPLPPINTNAPFRHSSTTKTSRSMATHDASYEKLEFLGDAHIELWASKLIYARLHHLPTGRMSQVRELLVKNETLAVYAKAYGFDQKLDVTDMKGMQAAASKANKGFNKVLGDVFEAYVAAICLADADKGEATAQAWVLALWEPALMQLQAEDRMIKPVDDGPKDPRTTYDDRAKDKLQRRLGCKGVLLEYVKDKPSVELKGNQLGQNLHFVALYLTGFGHEKKLLGKGEGKSKVEAGMWAAIEAMYGDNKGLVDECAARAKLSKQMRTPAKGESE